MVDFIARINVRQILIHFVATWLFVYAFYTLAGLLDYKFLYLENVDLSKTNVLPRITGDRRMINNMAYVGLAVATIIAVWLTIKHKWGLANPAINLIVIFILKYFGFLGWSTLQSFFMFPGSLLRFSIAAGLCLDGGLMLVFGLYLFFQHDIQKFIDKGAVHYDPVAGHKSARG